MFQAQSELTERLELLRQLAELEPDTQCQKWDADSEEWLLGLRTSKAPPRRVAWSPERGDYITSTAGEGELQTTMPTPEFITLTEEEVSMEPCRTLANVSSSPG